MLYHLIKIHEYSLHSYVPLDYLFQWTCVAMGLKRSGPYLQRSMASVVLAGLVYIICEIYIDDVLIHGRSEEDFLVNLRKVLDRRRQFNVAANPKKTKLGLSEVEYVGHVVSSEGTSFADEKKLKVLDFLLPETHRRKNLTYINKTPKGKVLRWNLFLQGFEFLLYHIPDALSRLCANLIKVVTLSAIDNKERIPGSL